ncbi:type II toxin-antitoxin system Phd/YefM family antitoxin [Brevibacterium album]|uniref:type II toxin-antitoxin system Phd/YefM family antitoxin n=1 Tax=Brevibacterium album TaxID=417948 RepID=UPI00040BBACA|nr:type II toxin-antitoxin system prevent-host-death family antitoxin [Brevibacterium album]
MDTISHREMRNRSGEILRRVEAGEALQVTNNGRLAAMIVPVTGSVLDGLIDRGEARAPVAPREDLLDVEPCASTASSSELVEDARGQW